MSERVIASNSDTESPEDFLERIQRDHSLIYETVRTYIPEGWEDAPRMAALITAMAVDFAKARGPAVGGELAQITLFGGSMAALGVAIDLTLGNEDGELTAHDVARSIAEAFAGQVAGLGIAAGVAAIGITGVGGVVLAAGLTTGAMALLSHGYDIFIDPYSKVEKNEQDNTVTATTALSFVDYFNYHWDDLGGYDSWTLTSEKSETEIWYRKSIDTYQFSTPQIDEKTFYRILEHESNSFDVIWDGAEDPVTDTVLSYYHDTVSELKEKAASTNQALSNQALYALISLRPFVLQNEQAVNYNALERSDYSENYLQDRTQFLYATIHDNPDSIRYEQRGENRADDFVVPGNGKSISSNYVFGTQERDGMMGDQKDDHLYGMGGNDTLSGQGGDDLLEGGKGQDTMDGGTGEDTFFVQGTDVDYDIFKGGAGEYRDTIRGSSGDDTIRVHEFTPDNSIERIIGGGGDNDVIAGTSLGDTIDLSGTEVIGIQRVEGGGGHDTLIGAKDNNDDVLVGGDGEDTLFGGEGNDTLFGANLNGDDDIASDVLEGGSGNDTYHVGNGDFVNDADQQGTVWLNGQLLPNMTLMQQGAGSDIYLSDKFVVKYDSAASTLTLFDRTSLHFFTIQNFSSGAFGITLQDYVVPQNTYDLTLTGTDDRDEMSIVPHGLDPSNWELAFTSFPDGVASNTPFFNAQLPASVPRLSVSGGGSNDFLFGFKGHDALEGGDGNDVIMGYLGSWGGTELTMSGPLEGDVIDGGDGNDWIQGSGGDDHLVGGEGNDIIQSYDGQDRLLGGSGDDVLAGGSHAAFLDGGAGDDVLLGDGYYTGSQAVTTDTIDNYSLTRTYETAGFVKTISTHGFNVNNDAPEAGNDMLFGGKGKDWLQGGAGDDILDGGEGDDALIGGSDNDNLQGGAGNDRLVGDRLDMTGSGDDILFGGKGSDQLYGCGGGDILDGGSGNDHLTGGEGDDIINGGTDVDVAYYSGALSDYSIHYVGEELHVGSQSEGTDRLHNIEYLRFSDQLVDLTAPAQVASVTAQTQENTPVVLSSEDLLANTVVPPGNDVQISSVHVVNGGSVEQDDSGAYVITPDAYFSGSLDVRFLVVDSFGRSIQSFAEITVGAVANSPELTVNATSGVEDKTIPLNIQACLLDLDGSESLEVEIFGVPAGASLSSGTDHGNGHWSLTSEQLAGLTITGAKNSDEDFILNVTARSLESNGAIAEVTASLPVTVEAVADLPELTVPNTVEGEVNSAIPLSIHAAPTDTDGSEALEVEIAGVPEGASLSAGIDQGAGRWLLTKDQLIDLSITPPENSYDDFNLSIVARSVEKNGSYTKAVKEIAVTVYGLADSPALEVTDVSGSVNETIALAIDASLVDQDGTEALSIDLSGVPEGAHLSAGVDLGGGHWVLQPEQIAGLTLTAPLDSEEDFTLQVAVRSTGIDGSVAESTSVINVAITPVPVIEGTDSADEFDLHPHPVIVYGYGGNDTLHGSSANDSLYGGAGDDTLYADEGNDTLIGGEGNDILVGGKGSDVYSFHSGFGQDQIGEIDQTNLIAEIERTSGAYAELAVAGISDDVDKIHLLDALPDQISVVRIDGDMQISVNGTDDRITIIDEFGRNGRIEEVHFSDGTVWDRNKLRIESNIVTAGDDWLTGGSGADNLAGGGGNDVIVGHSGNDLLEGESGDDLLSGADGDDTLHGGAGQDNLVGGLGNDSLYGNEGNDVLEGLDGDDLLFGGEGEDSLIGHDGNDHLDGGLGNDELNGGLGNDIYYWGLNSGQDTISDSGGLDSLTVGVGVLPQDVQVTRSRRSLFLSLSGTDDQIEIENWYDIDGNVQSPIDIVKFENGTKWTIDEIEELLIKTEHGTDESETLTGAVDRNNKVFAHGGDDNVIGTTHDDFLNGGNGDDVIYGHGGNDYIIGGSGDDNLFAHNTSNYYLMPQVVFEGGTGNDFIFGGAGNGTKYIFSAGDGQDAILDYGGSGDTISFTDTVSPDDIVITREKEDIIINIPDTGDRIKIGNWFGGEYYVHTTNNTKYYVRGVDVFRIERIEFSDGTVWDVDAVNERLNNAPVLTGALDDHYIHQGNSFFYEIASTTFSDVDPDDNLSYSATLDDGSPLPDWLLFDPATVTFGGTPNDDFTGPLNVKVVACDSVGQEVSDSFTINVLSLFSVYEGGSATLTTRHFLFDEKDSSGNSLTIENLTVDEGTVVDNGGGTWTFNAEPGWRGPVEFSYLINDGTSTRSSTAKLDVLPSLIDLGVINEGNTLVFSEEQIVAQFLNENSSFSIEDLSTDSGTLQSNGDGTWSFLPETGFTGKAQITFSSVDAAGEPRPEYATVQVLPEGTDLKAGTGGDDQLESGNSTSAAFEGLAGDDAIQGSSQSNDRYLFGRGSGKDSISDGHYGQPTTTNVVQFKEGVSIYDLELNLDYTANEWGSTGSSFSIGIKGTDDALIFSKYTYSGFLYGSNYLPEKFEFADGSTLSPQELLTFLGVNIQGEGTDLLHGGVAPDTIWGTQSNDTLYGEGGNDSLFGMQGDDTLEGGQGSDFLNGGAGNDSLSGGEGNDCYFFELGSGHDHISDSGAYSIGNNIIRFSDEITPENVAISRKGNDLCLILRNSEDQVTVSNWFAQEQYQAFQVDFSDGTQWGAEHLNAIADLGLTNSTPVLVTGLSDQSTDKGKSFSYQLPLGTFNDPDVGDDLVYNASLEDGAPLPSWLYFDISTGTFNGVPDINDIGTLNIKVTATDRFGARVSDVFSLTVDSANTGPEIVSPANFGVVQEDGSFLISSVALLENASDSDGDTLSVSNLAVDSGSITGNGDGSWTYKPDPDFNGAVIFNYLVSDGIESVATSANLEVTAVNDAPVIDATLADQAVDEGNPFSYQIPAGSFSDPDLGDSLSYSAVLEDGSSLPGWLTFDSATGGFSGTPTHSDVGAISIRVTATDSGGLSVSDIFVLTIDDPSALPVVSGSDAGESLVGTNGAEKIDARAGDDQLFGFGGADVLDAGEGADYLDGGAGDDTQLGGAGNDQLGGDAGNDLLVGGTGNDIYVYRPGSGADTIDNSDGGVDWLIFTDDISSNRLGYVKDGNNLIVRIDNDQNSQVTITDWFVSTDKQLSYIQPAGQGGIAASTITTLFDTTTGDDGGQGSQTETPDAGTFDSTVTGTDSAEQVVGNSGNNLLQGLAGDDQLFGLSGSDWLEAGDGADYLDGGAGDDTQLGGAGNDQLGGDAGTDLLIGGAGDDIYVYRPGAGVDTIDNAGGGTDWLIFTDDLTADRLSYHRSGDDLLVKVDNSEATMVRIKDWFESFGNRLSYIQPAGGYGISATQIESMLITSPSAGFDTAVHGSDNDDVLNGSSGADQLFGYDGNDQLSGADGNDELCGGDDADTLLGGLGDDVYSFRLGDGADSITDTAGSDTISFGVDVMTEGFSIFKSGSTLQIGYGSNDQITLTNYSDTTTGNRIENISMTDGSYMTDTDINQLIQEMSAYAATEGISLNSLDDVRQNEELMTMIAGSWQAA